MSPVSIDGVAQQWAAEEHVAAAKVAERVEAMHEAQAAAAAPGAVDAAKPVDPELAHLSGVLWFAADKMIGRYVGEGYALQPDELEKLAAATAPVLAKYLPQGLGALVATPEGALALTVLTIYGGKFATGALGTSAPSVAPPSPSPATVPGATA